MRAESPVRLALIGAGGWGKNLLRSFRELPGADVRWVCDLSEAARAAVLRNHPDLRVVARLEEVLAAHDVDAVAVATDAASHRAVAQAALAAGKDVFVEKPLALSVADAEAVCRMAEARGRVLMVGHLLLYHSAVEVLRRLVAEGELGSILYVHAQRLNLVGARPAEGPWWSLAPHDVAIANELLGAEPLAVSCVGARPSENPDGRCDVVFGTLRYPGDRLAHVHVSWVDPHKTRRLTVVGSRRMAVFDDTSADEKLAIFDRGVEPPRTASYAEGVRVRTGDIRIPAVRLEEPLRRECAAFVRAVRTREAPLSDGWSALRVVRALEAGERSLLEGGRAVAPAERR